MAPVIQDTVGSLTPDVDSAMRTNPARPVSPRPASDRRRETCRPYRDDRHVMGVTWRRPAGSNDRLAGLCGHLTCLPERLLPFDHLRQCENKANLAQVRWDRDMHHDISFYSEGAELRGVQFSHGEEGRPIVVMTHGTTATITMAIDIYAQRIFDSGYDVLLYDHRNFGRSSGEPRQEINPWIQSRGYRDAVSFLRNSKEDREVVLWGDSFSAGLALVAGALIENISAIIAQIPVCGPSIPDKDFDATALRTMKKVFDDGDVAGGSVHTTGPLPVVSFDQMNNPSLLTPIQAYRWFIEHGGRHGSGWENKATRVIPDTPVPCSPFVTAPYLNMPVQMMIGMADEMVHCNIEAQKAVFDLIPGQKDFQEIPGGHFGLLWHPSEEFEAAVGAQIAFLNGVFSPGG